MGHPHQTATDDPASSARVGGFEFHLADQRWVWSPAVARMHGYEPGEIEPTTELVLSHKHPDDASGVAALIEDVRRHGRAFSSRHRIIDTGGQVHVVVVVGDLMRDDDGRVLGTEASTSTSPRTTSVTFGGRSTTPSRIWPRTGSRSSRPRRS